MKAWAYKVVAIFAIVVGGTWIWYTFIIPVSRTAFEPFDIIISLLMLPLLSVPGAFAVFYGLKMFKTPDQTNITRSIGVFVYFAAGFLATEASLLVDEKHSNSLYGVTLIVVSLALLPVYVKLSGILMRWAGLSANSLSDFFGHPSAVLLSIGVWSALNGITVMFYPSTELDPGILSSIVVFGPVLVAIVFYKLFVRSVGIGYVRPQNGELTKA